MKHDNMSMDNTLPVSVVIGSYNRRELLALCIDAVRDELKATPHEIIVIDGGSSDGSLEWLTCQKDIILILQHNRGKWRGKEIKRKPWSYFMNLGFRSAQGKFICMLSDDSLIIPGCIRNGLDLAESQMAQGIRLGGIAFYFRDYPIRKNYAVAINVGNLYVNHGLYLREAMIDAGFCDESYHFYFADTDLSLRIIQSGYEIIRSPHSFVEHYFEATPELRSSNNNSNKEEDRLRLINKWAGIAYPAKDREKYLKVVGRWECHPDGYIDKSSTISRLVKASKRDSNIISSGEKDLIKGAQARPATKVHKVGPCNKSQIPIPVISSINFVDSLSTSDITQALYADYFWATNNNPDKVSRRCGYWVSRLYRSGIDRIQKRQFNTLFIRSLSRPDYKQLFDDIIDAFDEKDKFILDEFEQTFSSAPPSFSKIINISRELINECFRENDFTIRKYLTLKLAYYISIGVGIEDASFNNIVFFADMQPLEHMLSLFYGRIGIKTVTLQHGLYIDYGSHETVNQINYLHHPSQYFLAWGENTSSLIKRHHPSANVHICGKPRTYGLAKATQSGLPGSHIVVILDQNPFYDQNIEMCSIVSDVAKKIDLDIKARLHPSLDKKDFFARFPGITETVSFEGANIIIGHTSSLLYEAMALGYRIARFTSGIPALAIRDNLQFSSEPELASIINQPNEERGLGLEFIAFMGEESRNKYHSFYRSYLTQ